jgi:short-subunit dehydrogenase
VAADLESRFSVQTKVIAADFAAATDDTWEAISAVVSSVPVGVLINSAGVSYDHAGEQTPAPDCQDRMQSVSLCTHVQADDTLTGQCMAVQTTLMRSARRTLTA